MKYCNHSYTFYQNLLVNRLASPETVKKIISLGSSVQYHHKLEQPSIIKKIQVLDKQIELELLLLN